MINPFDADDVMIDIETLGLHPHNSLILSIGLVEFDPTPLAAPNINRQALIVPELLPQLMLGRLVQPSTVKFWQQQSEDASAHFRIGATNTLEETCDNIEGLLKGVKRVWARGVLFDLSNIAGLFDQVRGAPPPWHYQAPRDVRQVADLPKTRMMQSEDAPELVPHNPLSDCVQQIWTVWEHIQPDQAVLRACKTEPMCDPW